MEQTIFLNLIPLEATRNPDSSGLRADAASHILVAVPYVLPDTPRGWNVSSDKCRNAALCC